MLKIAIMITIAIMTIITTMIRIITKNKDNDDDNNAHNSNKRLSSQVRVCFAMLRTGVRLQQIASKPDVWTGESRAWLGASSPGLQFRNLTEVTIIGYKGFRA